MEYKRKLIDKPGAYAKMESNKNNNRVDELSASLLAYYRDDDKKFRRMIALCRYHYYIDTSRIGGAAITTTNCQYCNEEVVFGNTCAGVYCEKCAKQLNVCRHCGARLEQNATWNKTFFR